ncbi:hypothetical protein VD792_26625 [Pseudomonas aeruginosa]|uniref:hypothetical protein n=1 Tax=Pseudomonas aeruginosa TaxID=287 RepID=UPI002B4A0E8B|nr:hypothetical protein [Pseudomonas aeruginosa]MEB3081580.1 hypothetical protein [Pseudomonas aeruginosa]MEB3143036.1 hypothetical protein [Pseudomonas aeruginosa]
MDETKNPIDVPQRRYVIASREISANKIVTRNILFCTAWAGIDKVNGVAFLCHFDTPFSILSISKILSEIKRMVPGEHAFETKIVNGTFFLFPYSLLTRTILLLCLRFQSKIICRVKCERFLYLNLRRAVSIDLKKMKWSLEAYSWEPIQKKKLGWSLLMKIVKTHA